MLTADCRYCGDPIDHTKVCIDPEDQDQTCSWCADWSNEYEKVKQEGIEMNGLVTPEMMVNRKSTSEVSMREFFRSFWLA